jgi:hypothetical protein
MACDTVEAVARANVKVALVMQLVHVCSNAVLHSVRLDTMQVALLLLLLRLDALTTHYNSSSSSSSRHATMYKQQCLVH